MINKKYLQQNINQKLSKKLVMTLLVRNEEDIVEECIKFHLNSGVDFIIATDNASEDATRSILLKYQQLGVLHLIDEPSKDFDQVTWVDRMIKIAKMQYKADWIINVDADEFWFCNYGNIKLALPNLKDFQVVYANSLQINPNLENEEVFAIRPNLVGRVMPAWKCLHAAKGYKKNSMGNHSVMMKKGARNVYFASDVTIFHFGIRSYKQYERKVVNTYKSLALGVAQGKYKEDAGRHIKEYYEMYLNSTLQNHYNLLTQKKDQDLVDSRLYNFIKNNYQTPESKAAQDLFFNGKIVLNTKNKLEKIILSCKRRVAEIKNFL